MVTIKDSRVKAVGKRVSFTETYVMLRVDHGAPRREINSYLINTVKSFKSKKEKTNLNYQNRIKQGLSMKSQT